MTRKIDIKGYGGKYYITDEGEIFKRSKSGVRKMKPTSVGQVSLTRNNKSVLVSVSTLIKEHFFGISDPNILIYRKNGVSSDYRLQNLALMTRAEYNKKHGARPNYKAVAKICSKTKEVLDIYPSMTDAAKAHNVTARTIYNWCRGKHQNKTLPAYDFKYDADISY